MSIFTVRAWRGFGAGLAVLIVGFTGCASRSQDGGAAPAKTMSQLGAEMQSAGTMSQSDYIRQDNLAHAVSQTHTITDTDFSWTLAQLDKEKNSIARARAFNILAAIRPMSAAEKTQITAAISPFLSSSDRLDQLGAQRVQKAVQAGS